MTPSYDPVKQSDDLEDPPVIVEVVKPMEALHEENISGEDDDWNRAKCAGVVGGIAGCLTGGFWLSVICTTGCIYAAKQEGTAGDIARACGTCAIKTNVMAREVDEQHQVVDKCKIAAAAVWCKAKDLNQEHQIVEKTKECIKSEIGRATSELQSHHDLVCRLLLEKKKKHTKNKTKNKTNKK